MPVFDFNQEKKDAVDADKTYELVYSNERSTDAQHPIMLLENSNKKLVPEAMSALDKFKYDVASEVGVTLKDGYNGDISAKDAGKIGGNMVRKMIQQVENNMANK